MHSRGLACWTAIPSASAAVGRCAPAAPLEGSRCAARAHLRIGWRVTRGERSWVDGIREEKPGVHAELHSCTHTHESCTLTAL